MEATVAEYVVSTLPTKSRKEVTPDDEIVVMLSYHKLQIEQLFARATDGRCGAVSSFLGTTRDNFQEKNVTRLEYEAYVPMAIAKMRQLGEKAFSDFDGVHKFVCAHRLGNVPVGEPSVVIIVSTEHRAPGLAAAASTIDELKAIVPIWKKEWYADGTSEVPHCCGGHHNHGVEKPTESDASWKKNAEWHPENPK